MKRKLKRKLWKRFSLPQLEDWKTAARDWAPQIKPGDWIALEGEMGVGKTLAVRETLRALGYQEPVPSPTYPLMLVHEWIGNAHDQKRVFHIDAYRLQGEEPWDHREWGDAVVFVEWRERTRLPEERFTAVWKIQRTGNSNERTLEMWTQAR